LPIRMPWLSGERWIQRLCSATGDYARFMSHAESECVELVAVISDHFGWRGPLLERNPGQASSEGGGTPSWPAQRMDGAPAGLLGPSQWIRLAHDRQQLTFSLTGSMKATTQDSVPRSAFDRTGGIVISLGCSTKFASTALALYALTIMPTSARAFDGRCCRFLGVEYAALRDRVLEGGH